MENKPDKAYARAGVDIALADRLLKTLKPDFKQASRPEVLGAIGGFGGLFNVSGHGRKEAVLVASTDSVGTKVKAAVMANEHRFIGFDIVHHCANDVAVTGAEPIFFLDYFATDKLEEAVYLPVMKGLAKACKQAGVALLGGETAELPGVYAPGHYDLVGTVVGLGERSRLLSGDPSKPGDILLGIASNGLHTNGFSLARKVLFEECQLSPHEPLPGFKKTVGQFLLAPHTNYAPLLLKLFEHFNKGPNSGERKDNALFAAAHITGGGIPGNLPRVLPKGIGAMIDPSSWSIPALFRFLAKHGTISREELFEVFNMGIGMILVVKSEAADAILDATQAEGHKAWEIGHLTNSGTIEIS
jgi:phosphoribosylformylglycinamidine cyclo-ligase